MKLLAQAMLEATKGDNSVGQLIFDINANMPMTTHKMGTNRSDLRMRNAVLYMH